MGRPRKWESDAERIAYHNSKRGHKPKPAKFVGVDGEGMGNGREHRYVLLSVGDRSIQNAHGLKFPEIMEFLCSQYSADKVFAVFFLGYDFTLWLKGLPEV